MQDFTVREVKTEGILHLSYARPVTTVNSALQIQNPVPTALTLTTLATLSLQIAYHALRVSTENVLTSTIHTFMNITENVLSNLGSTRILVC